MTGAAPSVSIVIPAFNRVELTARCLRALAANTRETSYELVIVDNASTDATPRLCESLGGRVTVIRNETNRGFAAACNQGAGVAAADTLVFLNTDTEPFPGWLPPSLRVLEDDESVAMVGMRLLFPDHSVQHAGVAIVERDETPSLVAVHMPYRVPSSDPLAGLTREVSAVTAASVMVRRDAFVAAGGFDEGYWNGYEDVDLCLTLRSRGWRIVYQSESVLIHHESASGPERFRREDDNVRRLQERWAGKTVPDFFARGDQAWPNPAGVHARSMEASKS